MTSESTVAAPAAPEVCLVAMPYAELPRPSLALGLLKGILTQDGISTATVHANAWFAETVGLRLYQMCAAYSPPDFLAGEWTFAGAAFPENRDRDEDYLGQVASTCLQLLSYSETSEALVADLRALRQAATEFVDLAARRVLATGVRIVGCTSTFEQHVASLALLRRIHELDPGVITMMGGANCETVMGQATHRCFPWVDYVVSGEADGIISGLCRLALTRGRDVAASELPPGVLGPAHRARGGQAPGRVRPLPRAMFRDLDSLPTPRFGDYFEWLAGSPLRTRIRPGLPVETSRGCWWGDRHQCTFCGLNGSSMAFRSKSPERVLTELHELEERYHISDFEIVDNILDMGYFKSVLPSLAQEAHPRRLFYEVKANLGRRHVEALVQAGVTWVQPGIESLHSEVLQLMDKGIRGWQNIQLMKWAREFGLRLSWLMLWGFPGERDEYYQEMARWLPLLEHLQPPAGVVRLRYERYSVYHEQAQRMGLLLQPVRSMSYVYPVRPADLDDLAYFFAPAHAPGPLDGYGDNAELARTRPGVTVVQQLTRRWRSSFSHGPRPVLSMKDRGDVLDVIDSRSCAVRGRSTLRGLARVICLACDSAPRADQLADNLQRDFGLSVAADEVSAEVEKLVRDRLVLPIDGRLLGLAISGSIPGLPTGTDFPGGYVHSSATAEPVHTVEGRGTLEKVGAA